MFKLWRTERKTRGKGLTKALQNIRQNGINEYAEEMEKKVTKGYSYLEERQ